MSIETNLKYIDEHIERVLLLLKKINYIPQATALNTHERKKLYELLFTYDTYGNEKSIYDEYYNLKTQEEVQVLNQKVFENMDEETRTIISKCGVSPKKVFSMDEGDCDIDRQLLDSMQAYGIAQVGQYTIEIIRRHPIDRHSAEIESFREDVRQEKFDKYKDGEATFRVSCEINGEKKQIYYHSEDMHFGGLISFMGQQIGGNFGFEGVLRFSSSSGMMKKDEGRANVINSLLPFFESFENLLSQEIMNGLSNDVIEDEYEKPKTMQIINLQK